jgi:hypothetical protein
MKCYISFILQYIVFQVLPSILFLKNNTACGVAGTFCHRRQTR